VHLPRSKCDGRTIKHQQLANLSALLEAATGAIEGVLAARSATSPDAAPANRSAMPSRRTRSESAEHHRTERTYSPLANNTGHVGPVRPH
jgi:hypothetical protein